VSIHASYLVNLPGPDAVTFERSVSMLVSELDTAPSFGAAFVNVHIGSHRGAGADVGIARLVEGIGRVLDRATCDAGGGQARPRELARVGVAASGRKSMSSRRSRMPSTRDGVDRRTIGFCIDVAHAWGAGIDVGDPAAIDAFLDVFDERIGLDRLVMIHLNDTRSEFGSRTDRHEHLGAGRIPSPGCATSSGTHASPTSRTSSRRQAWNRATTREPRASPPAVGGKRLPTLPPEAFTLPSSSRGRMSAKRSSPA
jgi:deoxyribonuclease-4